MSSSEVSDWAHQADRAHPYRLCAEAWTVDGQILNFNFPSHQSPLTLSSKFSSDRVSLTQEPSGLQWLNLETVDIGSLRAQSTRLSSDADGMGHMAKGLQYL